jgi:hypothetical protein
MPGMFGNVGVSMNSQRPKSAVDQRPKSAVEGALVRPKSAVEKTVLSTFPTAKKCRSI